MLKLGDTSRRTGYNRPTSSTENGPSKKDSLNDIPTTPKPTNAMLPAKGEPLINSPSRRAA
jgi:hypothetical protein